MNSIRIPPGGRYHEVNLGSVSDGFGRKLHCDAWPQRDFSKQSIEAFGIADLQCKVVRSQVLLSVEFGVDGALHLPERNRIVTVRNECRRIAQITPQRLSNPGTRRRTVWPPQGRGP